ncbi:MAG TPA: L-seryl-tRNA(Sec) selenium transferase [Candidatus Obscuribacterales bacterium]
MNKTSIAARIPQVDKLLRHDLLVQQQRHMRRAVLAVLVREELERVRAGLVSGQDVPDLDAIARRVAATAQDLIRPAMRKVLNGTGIALNTNLGRAPLPEAAIAHLQQVCCGYTNLEIDLETGRRGERGLNVERLLQVLTGCQAALVVNNNAAAVLLAVNTLSRDKEVIISRGELIEIGGSFRLPDIIASSGAILKEVGTTNRTRIADYRKAISDRTGLLLRCHRSNFQITGFAEQAELTELVALSRQASLPLVEDLGSGVLSGLPVFQNEPTVQAVLEKGCPLVTFSGDKLMGGPQAGIIAGDRELVKRLHANPLYRALRADKMVLSVLESVLAAYLSPDPENRIPILSVLIASPEQLKKRAESFAAKANLSLKNLRLAAVPTSAAAGGGSLPGTILESFGISLASSLPAGDLAALLRGAEPAVVPVVHADRVVVDFRTIAPGEEELLLACLVQTEALIAGQQPSHNLSDTERK